MRKLRHIITTALMALTLLTWSSVGWGQIISQYIDTYTGTVPKGIEIWNNTETTLDFSINNLIIQQGTNGGALTDLAGSLINAGELAPNAVLVIGTTGIGTYLTNEGLTSVTFKEFAFAFNGDDALAVKYGGTITDVFGTPGVDPGTDWIGNGVSTRDQNIQLKSGITTGNTVGWTDPSTRFETVSTDNTLTGFGLAPEPDTEAPVPTFFPLDAATGVAVDVNPTITFDEAIYLSGSPVIDADLIDLVEFTDGTNPVGHAAIITGNVITIYPDTELSNEQSYTLTINEVEDAAANAMTAPATVTFTTIALAAETIELTGTYTGPYYAGDEVTVTWNAANFDNVVVEAWVPSLNEGVGGWEIMVATTPAIDGTATFTIPANSQFSAAYKLRVADVADGDPFAETATFKVREVHTALSTLRARPNNTEARFDGSAVVTYARPSTGRNQKYVQDDVAAILIDDSTPIITEAYPIGSEITGLVGRINIFNALVQFVPLENPGVPASLDNPVVPFVTDLASLTTADQAKLIKLENISFTTFGTGLFVTNTSYTITDAAEATSTFRSSFSEVDYIGQAVPTNNIVEMLAVVNEFNGTMQIVSRSMADWLIYSDDATLATFTLGGLDALGLTDVVVADPLVDAGATLFVEDLVDFAGIVVTATDAAATFEVKLNDVVVDPVDFATQALVADDVVVVTVEAEDGTMAYYKVTIQGDNRELTLTSPTGVVSLNTGEDLVVTWTSANIANVNIFAVDGTKAVNQINEDPIDATLGTYTTEIPNGVFGEFFIRITDATDETFFDETETAVTVVDTQAPAGVEFSPAFGAVDVSRSFTLSIEFDEDVVAGVGNLTIHKASDNSVVVTLAETDVTIVDNVVTAMVEDLAYGTAFYVLIDAGMVEDLAGNGIAAVAEPATWTFTTLEEPGMDLFISEYLEGSSSNKALEIYNPTSLAVDLSNYVIKQANNGTGWGNVGGTPDTRYVLPLTGTLEPGEVLVLANAASNPTILAVADYTYAYDAVANGSDGSNVLAYNGDDAIGLFKNDVLIDVIGDPNLDPGANWPVAGTGATSEFTLVRKASVAMGNTDWAASAGTDASNSEWIVYPQDTFDYLGTHSSTSSDATLATFTLGGENVLGLANVVVADPADAGATLLVESFTDFAGIVVTTTDETATFEVKLNDVVVDPADYATQILDADDVILVTVTAEDATVAYYKVTVIGDNRELTLTAPTGTVTLNTGDDLVVTWTSANIANVNIYAVDPIAKETIDLINEEGPIDATLGTYTKTIDNGIFGDYFIRIADATDATFFDETETAVTVVDNQAPAVVELSPVSGAVNVFRSFTLSIEFDEDVAAGTGNLTIHDASDDAVVVIIAETDVTIVDNVVTAAVAGLAYETEYYVLIGAGMIEDLAGNGVAAITDPTTWTFTTLDEPVMDLFFSEYLEGSSNNKAIEIFNPMSQAVDLSAYEVRLFGNGASDPNQTQALTGTLEPGEVFVIANSGSVADILDVADITSAVTFFNGDDALGLFKNDVLIDVFGTIGYDPGTTWAVAGVADATAEHTLVRKGSVIMGNTNWEASAGTDANDSEWIVFPQNTFDYLGFHIAGQSSEADILTFEVPNQMDPAIIDAEAATVYVEVLFGTDITNIAPSISVSLGATYEPTGPQDFTDPVEYTVTAEDGSPKVWNVRVVEAAISDRAEVLAFVVEEAVGAVVIDSEAATIDLTVAVGTDITAITPSITISLGATIDPAGGTAQDFTNPVVYTVTAQDGTTTKDWTVTVSVSQIIPIYDIQFTDHPEGASMYEGQVVTTQGIVTAHHFNYEGGTFRGIFIQDGAGEWNGLYVYNQYMEVIPEVGDEITITGLVEEYYTLTELTSGGGTVDMIIEILSTGNDLPAPVVVTTEEAATEPYEGVLVTVENAEYTVAPDNYNVLGVNDGSGVVYLDDDMYDYMDFMTMNSSYNITGIGHFSYDLPKILPRFAEDIELVSSVKPIWGESIAAYPNPFTSTIWIDNAENASRVDVVNLVGQRVMSINLNGDSRATIQTDNLPSGVYLVTIVNNQGQRTVRKMIKQ